MSATQLSFSLRTRSGVKAVHLIGSWDGYQAQIPLSKEFKGQWKGTFRFQTSILAPGQRYWYYYMIDGYQVSHDPASEYTTEPTTGRKLNILDVPACRDAAAKRAARRQARAIPQGRSVSPSSIKSPKPQRPGQTTNIVNGQYTEASLAALNSRFAQTSLYESEDESDDESECSDVPSLTSSRSSRSSRSSSPSSVLSSCSCQRYGITRSGDRVKLDCGGSRCGNSDAACSDSEEESYKFNISTRRHGVVIRA